MNIKDIRISSDMLHAQAQIAASAGKPQIGENLKRAAEMTQIPDDELIKMYDMLRPNRSTKQQLVELAQKLEQQYQATIVRSSSVKPRRCMSAGDSEKS